MNRFCAMGFGIVTLLALLLASAAMAREDAVIAPERGLQTELEPVAADMDWRGEVGLAEHQEREAWELPAAIAWLLANLVMIIFLAAALVIIVLIVAVLVNYGGSGGFRAGAEADAGVRGDGENSSSGIVLDAPRLGLDEILGLEDLDAALGALLRLVLEAALSLSGSVLRRSSTARDILRRLPSDFAHLSAVATLVREAERVRYGGASITRDRFEALVELVGPLLTAEHSS